MNVAQCNEMMAYVIRAINAVEEGKATIKSIVSSFRVNVATCAATSNDNNVITRCDIEDESMYKRKAVLKADLLNVKHTIEAEKQAAVAEALESSVERVVEAAVERVKGLVTVEHMKVAKAFYVRVESNTVSFSLTRYNEQVEHDVELFSETVGVYNAVHVGAVYRAIIELLSTLKPVKEKSRVYTNKGKSIFTFDEYEALEMTTTNFGALSVGDTFTHGGYQYTKTTVNYLDAIGEGSLPVNASPVETVIRPDYVLFFNNEDVVSI